MCGSHNHNGYLLSLRGYLLTFLPHLTTLLGPDNLLPMARPWEDWLTVCPAEAGVQSES